MSIDNNFPVFATNDLETKETVAGAINKLFRLSREGAAQAPALAIATAYLNPGGFMVLADEIESAPKVPAANGQVRPCGRGFSAYALGR